MALVLVFNKEATLDGLVYPAGALVPAGVLRPSMLTSLRDSKRIIEVREEDLSNGQIPLPHRVPTMDEAVVTHAKGHRDQTKREFDAAEKHYKELKAIWDADHAPIAETVPETAGTTTDFSEFALKPEDVPLPPAVPELEDEVTPEEEVASEDETEEELPAHLK